MKLFSPSRVRLMLLTVLFGGAVVLLVARLWTLQIRQRDVYIEQIPGSSTLTVREPATRGRIYDQRGRLLVDNVIRYEASFDLEEMKAAYRAETGHEAPRTTYDTLVAGRAGLRQNTEADIVAIFKEIAIPRLDLVGLASDFNARSMRTHYRTHRGLIPWVYRPDLSYKEFAKFAENAGLVPGLSARYRPQRRYLHGAMASHILGYMKASVDGTLPEDERGHFNHFLPDDEGATGIEASFERYLRGRAGRRTLKKDEKGNVIGRWDSRLRCPGRTCT